MDEASGDMPLPPATFEFFVLSMKTQAEIALGLLQFPGKDLPEPDLRVARHSIDLLAMISGKTRGNLSIDEQRLIENSLTELRFRYVQATEAHNRKQASATQADEVTSEEPTQTQEPNQG
jgi:hypothetical protein